MDSVANNNSGNIRIIYDGDAESGDSNFMAIQGRTGDAEFNNTLIHMQLGGNVGIGTTSPYCQFQIGDPRRGDGETSELGKLVVAGPISTPTNDFTNSTAIFRVIGTDATNNLQMGVGGSGDYSFNPWIQASYDNTDGGGSDAGNKDLLLNPLGGNVGIGVTDPVSSLHVQQTSNTSNSSGNVTGSIGDGITLQQFNSTNKYHFSIDSDSSGPELYIVDNVGFDGIAINGGSGNHINVTFTGQHRSLANTNLSISSKGLIVSGSGDFVNLDLSNIPTINESLPIVSLTNSDNDKKVFGVISDIEDNNTTRRKHYAGSITSLLSKKTNNEQRLFINSLGEGGIWVCNKGSSNIENGDYITSSSVTGYGMKQTLHEGILTNFTVAKITCDCNFSLEKITKQKLKVITTTTDGVTTTTTSPEGITTTTTSDPITTTSIDYDENGNVQYEDDLDENGNTQQVYKYETRFLDGGGNLLIDEADYNTRLGNEESVYIACFVGCTYHCG